MVPLRAGVLSALGLLVAPPAYDIVRTHKVPLKELDAAPAGTLMEEMADSIAALPGSPLSCHARFAADSKSHQLDRELSALGPTTNLVDDMVDSRWTLTVAAWLLRSHGSGEVWPFALALTSHG